MIQQGSRQILLNDSSIRISMPFTAYFVYRIAAVAGPSGDVVIVFNKVQSTVRRAANFPPSSSIRCTVSFIELVWVAYRKSS